jgi:hypothetical protein
MCVRSAHARRCPLRALQGSHGKFVCAAESARTGGRGSRRGKAFASTGKRHYPMQRYRWLRDCLRRLEWRDLRYQGVRDGSRELSHGGLAGKVACGVCGAAQRVPAQRRSAGQPAYDSGPVQRLLEGQRVSSAHRRSRLRKSTSENWSVQDHSRGLHQTHRGTKEELVRRVVHVGKNWNSRWRDRRRCPGGIRNRRRQRAGCRDRRGCGFCCGRSCECLALGDEETVTAEQAIDVARDFARGRSYRTAAYDATATKQGAVWRVIFHPKEPKPRPGDFFSVYIDETTSKVRLVQGK